MRIIPAIDIMDGRVVRLLRGDPENKTIYDDSPVEVARRWESHGADMLHIVDLDATLRLGGNSELIQDMAQAVSIPVEIAGGLRSEELASRAARHASRIVLGTLAFRDRSALGRLAEQYGHERIVISVDHTDGIVMIDGWQSSTGADLFDSMREFASMGFCDFLLTNVARDGTLSGPDLENLRRACGIAGVRVIASGGISSVQDVRDVRDSGAHGVILGKALYEGLVDIRGARTC